MLSSSQKRRPVPEGFRQQQKVHGRVAVVLLFLGMYVFVGPLFLHLFLSSELEKFLSTEEIILAARTSEYSHKRPVNHILILSVENIGDIRITLRPEWSPDSVDYVKRLVEHGHCQRCNLYRAEKPGILQGVMAAPSVPLAERRGTCPAGAEAVKNECPPWDAECGCHGPVMKRGYVAWAAGKTGPDFFIDAYPKAAVWWGTQHTVWGEIKDVASLHLIDNHIFSLPVHNQGGLNMLDEPIHFDLSWENVQ